MRAYHITSDTLRDGRPLPAIGETLHHDGPVRLCASGLHASIHILNALKYCPYNPTWIHVVECEGEIQQGSDKLSCSQRTIVESHPWDTRAVVILALECAALSCASAGAPYQDLLDVAHDPNSTWQQMQSAALDAYDDALAPTALTARHAYLEACSDAALTARYAAYDAAARAANAAANAANAAAAEAAAYTAYTTALPVWETGELRAVELLTGGAK